MCLVLLLFSRYQLLQHRRFWAQLNASSHLAVPVCQVVEGLFFLKTAVSIKTHEKVFK